MSTARSSSDSGGASLSGACGIGGAPASSRTRLTPSSGPLTSRTSPATTISSGPGSNSHRMSERIAITHIPVSVGSESSRRVWPAAADPSRTRTRAVISSACRRSGRSTSGIPRRAAITRAMSEAASPTFWMASAIQSTPAMPSASSGLRAASIAIVRSLRRYRVDRSSSRPTSSASFSSLKKTAAYARSTISSEASFSSTSRSLTVFGSCSSMEHSR